MKAPELVIQTQLEYLYGRAAAKDIWNTLRGILEEFNNRDLPNHPQYKDDLLTEKDAVLITYADQFKQPGQSDLATLNTFLKKHLGESISAVHLLPFFPFSSDDGFSVIDYKEVNRYYGGWEDIQEIGREYRLMFDAVINHISRKSTWFLKYLNGEPQFSDYFIEIQPDADLSNVTRPRALPLLTAVETAAGRRHVWTTFSADQIDLNYANPHVLLEITKILLFYVQQGAEIIRLDAIAYLWKEIGTTCIHLDQTHAVIKFWRAVLDLTAPGVILITETNVPHDENISYFGDGTDEAQLVYQFPLGPLVIHSFLAGNAEKLTSWAAALKPPSSQTTFFNFIASHDGIGVRPAEGILSDEEIQALVDCTLAHGGKQSVRSHPDGSISTYELNITLYDFLNGPEDKDQDENVQKFLASQAIMLSLAGVPGIYVHSLFGSNNCLDCLEETGRARSINREKFYLHQLEELLGNPNRHYSRVLQGYSRLLDFRKEQPAFHPNSAQTVLPIHPVVFALERGAGREKVICLTNVSNQQVQLELEHLEGSWVDLLTAESVMSLGGRLPVTLAGYQHRWLKSLR